MQYYDPARPEINFRPAYVSPSGKPIAPIPALAINPIFKEAGKCPHSEQMIELGCFLLAGRVSAAWYSIDIPLSSLAGAYAEFLSDVELFFQKHFSYSYEPETSSPPRLALIRDPAAPAVTLASLGLLPQKES